MITPSANTPATVIQTSIHLIANTRAATGWPRTLIQPSRMPGEKTRIALTLKSLARDAVDTEGQVVVYLKRPVIVALPDRDVDLGELTAGDRIIGGAAETSIGRVFEASKIPTDEIPAPSSVENESTRSARAGRSHLIGRAMAENASRTAVFHELEQALDRLRAPD